MQSRKKKNMVEILKFFYAMNIFIFLIILSAKVRGGKPFLLSYSHFLLCFISSYTIFYHVLITLFYYLFSLQHILILLSLFITAHIKCETDDDCPKSLNNLLAIKCIDHVCKFVSNLSQFEDLF
ncbi:putative Late nodulin [Medicago truncatula]|uniref:Putative Late nodulin n=1 Tax=Medicago truncatula TaxID=3880 RepID=A0A396J4V2_MEDTR|nr:putative Late nodulin [Medicago truncatula]